MAATTVAASSVVSTSAFLGSKSVSGNRASVKPVVGLPALRTTRIVCSAEKKDEQNLLPKMAASLTAAATLVAAHPAVALVDERLSTEGTGLSLGVNSPSLGWILVIVPFILWTIFYNFSQTLPKDDDSGGLSL